MENSKIQINGLLSRKTTRSDVRRMSQLLHFCSTYFLTRVIKRQNHQQNIQGFEDNIVITGRSLKAVKEDFSNYNEEAIAMRLEINEQ